MRMRRERGGAGKKGSGAGGVGQDHVCAIFADSAL